MKMILNGKDLDSSSGAQLEIKNPYDGSVIDTVPIATEEEVDQAVSGAVSAQKEWNKIPVFERSEVIKKFITLVDENKEKLAQSLSREMGKPINEARGEIQCARDTFLSFSEKARHVYGQIIPAGCEPGTDKTVLLTVREPLGVIACIIPFNFPCWSFSVKVAPAIIAGNAAIVKPSSDAPLTILMLGGLMREAGLPSGVLQIITGGGSSVGARLCRNKDVHGITLTGSTSVGIETARAGAEHLAHVTLELGGNDAFIVLEDADLELAAEQVIGGRMSNNGQVCCSPKRYLVQENVKDEFINKVSEKIEKLRRGDPREEDSQISCLVSIKAAKEVENQVNLTVGQGAKIIRGGKREDAYYEPTILTDVTREMDVANDMEIFGPVVPVISVKDLDEAIEIANQSVYGLGGCIFTRDMGKAVKAARELQAGGIIINGSSYFSTIEMAFGGYKYSGIGREGVSVSYDDVTQVKTIVLKNIL
ncbi:aldehyde dehydrogenase family protein [[Clostridium] symbiosum]|uniref:aldehyde dehydrogenase family protein n=1 Tax=Clostridium symbiosum TaxID=1512 RepID=UPI001D07308B|nr:aldehyde dehydrogenase family protein [[Clostridium] symbiosum]MCB6610611.1 aldehyde dehydrogenase family protein [[Clostridium] symbiosum]MCB6930943.1 aldehyde dehydrogenase family protein [[Clostridium] symbiosum]